VPVPARGLPLGTIVVEVSIGDTSGRTVYGCSRMTSCPCERCHRARTGSHSTRPPSRTRWCRRTAADSGTRSTGARRWATGMPRSRVSGVGPKVRFPRSTLKLARHVERGTGRIRSATVSHRVGRWQVSFSVEITRNDPALSRPDTVVGVDLGIMSLAVLSTGEVIPDPRHLEIAQREPGRPQRQASRVSARIGGPGGPLSAMASHPGPHRPPAHRCRQRPPRRSAPTHHPPGAHPRHDRDRRPQASPAWEIVAWLATSRVSGVAASGRVQNRLVGCAAAVSQFQNLFVLRRGENQTAPVRTHSELACGGGNRRLQGAKVVLTAA
jgi:hypothetical protein